MSDQEKTPEKKSPAAGSNDDTSESSPGDHGDKPKAADSSISDSMMFAFDQSPHSSPARNPAPSRGAASAGPGDSPTHSPRSKKLNTGANFMTQSSPPRFVSFEEIMKAANGVTNMTLAHEIAVDNEFRFQKQEPAPNSIEKQVREVMHRAFWDVLQEQLHDDPPEYNQALVLLKEVKENVLDLMLPHHHRIQGQIEEVLDLGLIEQQADHGALDVQYYADFVISIMAKLCAPVRDDDIAKLSTIKEIVPLFKEIFAMLDVLKLDMANFTIQQIRPYIQNQSVDYERTKFKDLLKQQEENNQDGLECTKAWLNRAGDRIYEQLQSQPPVSDGTEVKVKTASPAAIINTAYVELLDWPENYVFPETLLLDHKRFLDLKEKSQWLALMASVVMVTYNMVGDPIAGVRSFKEKLKDIMVLIIADVPFDNVSSVMPHIGEQVVKEVQDCLREHGYPPMVDGRAKMLKGLVESVGSSEQAVHKCLRKRLLDCMLLSNPGSRQIQVPSGFASMAEEFSHVYGQFLRLVSHNRTVYGLYYADIISKYLKSKEESNTETTAAL